MAWVKNVSNVGNDVNLDAVVGIVKTGTLGLQFRTIGGRNVNWTFANQTKRDNCYTNLATQVAAVAIAE